MVGNTLHGVSVCAVCLAGDQPVGQYQGGGGGGGGGGGRGGAGLCRLAQV